MERSSTFYQEVGVRKIEWEKEPFLTVDQGVLGRVLLIKRIDMFYATFLSVKYDTTCQSWQNLTKHRCSLAVSQDHLIGILALH